MGIASSFFVTFAVASFFFLSFLNVLGRECTLLLVLLLLLLLLLLHLTVPWQKLSCCCCRCCCCCWRCRRLLLFSPELAPLLETPRPLLLYFEDNFLFISKFERAAQVLIDLFLETSCQARGAENSTKSLSTKMHRFLKVSLSQTFRLACFPTEEIS